MQGAVCVDDATSSMHGGASLGRNDVTDDLSPDERAELLRLRARVTELEATQAGLSPERSRTPTRLRWVAAVVLIVLGAVCATAGVTALWAKRMVFDTDRYVATVAPLASDPGVQELATTEISNVVFENVDIDALVTQTLDALAARGVPSQVTALAGPMADGIRSFVTNAIGDIVASDRFEQAWVEANRVAHTELVKTLTGEQAGVALNTDSITVELGPFIAEVKQHLVDEGFGLASRIPDVSVEFTVAQGVNVAGIQRLTELLDTVGTWLPWLAIVLLVAGAFVAPRRRTGAIIAAAALVVSMVVLAVLVALIRSWLVGRLADASIPVSTAQTIVSDLTYFLRMSLRTTAVLGLIVLLLTWLTGRSGAARGLRRGIANTAAAIRGRVSPGAQPSAVERFMGKYEILVSGAVVLIGIVIVLSWDTVSPARLAILGLIVLVLVVIIHGIAAASRDVPPPVAADPLAQPQPEVRS
jgi:hypothetical protein